MKGGKGYNMIKAMESKNAWWFLNVLVVLQLIYSKILYNKVLVHVY